mgnify:CR=1 FL=1
MESGKKKDVVSWAHSKVPDLESLNSLVKFLFERRMLMLFVIAAAVLLFFFWGYVKTLAVMVFFISIKDSVITRNRQLIVTC